MHKYIKRQGKSLLDYFYKLSCVTEILLNIWTISLFKDYIDNFSLRNIIK